MGNKKLSIIVPVFNEAGNLPKFFSRIKNFKLENWDLEWVFVDDFSNDGGKSFLQNEIKNLGSQNKALFHEKNLGKGAAVRTGLNASTGDFAVILDSDNEYEPEDICKMAEKSSFDAAVFGKRVNRGWRGYWYFVLGNYFMNLAISFISRTRITDSYTGLKLLSLENWKLFDLKENGFSMEAEITAKILKKRMRIVFVPVWYEPRKFEEGKKITIADGFKGFFIFIKYYFFKKP